MRAVAWALTILAACSQVVAAAEAEARVVRSGDWQRLEARLPGRLVSYALPKTASGARRIVALVDPAQLEPPAVPPAEESAPEEDGDARALPPCPENATDETRWLELYRIDPQDPAAPELLHDRIPHDISAVDTADLDADGADDLLLARPGELFVLEEGGLVSVLTAPDLKWNTLHPRAVEAPALDGWPVVRIYGFGSLDLHGPGQDSRSWVHLARAELPIEAEISSNALVVRRIVPRFIGRRADGTMLFATPATTRGAQRVETRLIEVPTSGEARFTESWSRLPAREMILEQEFLMLGDEPVLLLTTKTADKLNLFGEKQLRLYPVARDRSRLGRHPSFAAATRMNLWQTVTPFVLDVNADGHEDLVLGYWKGLKDARIVLDAYLRSEDGSFETTPRTTAFNVEDGDRSFVGYGRDLDADGLPDLLLRNEHGHLLLFAGLPSTRGKKLVATRPERLPIGEHAEAVPGTVFELSLGDAPSVRQTPVNHPRFADIDGDGRPEIVLVGRGDDEAPATFDVVSFALENR